MEYRGYIIEKFYSKEIVPKHIVRQYYQSEKLKIDREIEVKENRKRAIENGFIEENMDDALNDFFNSLE